MTAVLVPFDRDSAQAEDVTPLLRMFCSVCGARDAFPISGDWETVTIGDLHAASVVARSAGWCMRREHDTLCCPKCASEHGDPETEAVPPSEVVARLFAPAGSPT